MIDINATFRRQTLFGDEEEEVQDEEMLIDFHLGNAINLDVVESVVLDKDQGYRLFVPNYDIDSWNQISKLIPVGYDKHIGFLAITCKLLKLKSCETLLKPTLYKELTRIVGVALEQRGINIPLVQNLPGLINSKIMVSAIYDKLFHRVLMSIATLSETLRKQSHQIFSAVSIAADQFAYTDLLPGELNCVLITGRNFSCIIDHDKREVHIGNYDSVLLLMDTLGQRLCAEIGCQFTKISNTPGCIDIEVLREIIFIGDSVLQIMGNDGYEVIALFEATVVSVILYRSPDGINDSEEFFNNCMKELVDVANTNIYVLDIIKLWSDLLTILGKVPMEWLSNIFCLYRIWGHPRVNIKEGMEKVYSKGTKRKITLSHSKDIVLCQFKHMFLYNYLKRHAEYPPFSIDDRKSPESSYVLSRLQSGQTVIPNRSGYNVWDYEHVTIEPIWKIPETYDVFHILNDKAVSPNRSELYQSVKQGKGTALGTLRRGIIRWMEGESIRCKQFLEHIDQEGLDEDSCIIGMYEKEREIKVKARMFSLMSEKMRMYFVLTEELIAKHILSYFPEITMKDPLNVQQRKIWKVGGKGQNKYNPNINIDFEKWNLNMRDEFTGGLFKQFDRIFGFSNLISRTHEIFKKSFIYSSSGKYNPKINETGFVMDPPMAYTGHLGGFEGLRQKGWTIATVVLLAYTAYSNSIQMCLLGQGDNQVLKLYMPIKKWNNLNYTEEARIQESRELTNKYIKEMHVNFTDAGLPIKIRETWVSTRLFMYGKSMYLNGECQPQWMKKLLRTYALTNEGTMTMSGMIGTIATNMAAAAGASSHPDIMYALFLYMAEWTADFVFTYHPFTRETLEPGKIYEFYIPGDRKLYKTDPLCIKRLMTTMLMIPTAAGGSVTQPLTGFIFRGFPDHASEAYTWIKLLKSVKSPFQSLFENWYSFLPNDTIEADMLVQSPWSLNHKKLPTPGIQSREMVRDWMVSGRFRKNRFLRNMKSIDLSFDRKAICKELLTDPMNPLVTYEIYNTFPQPYCDSVLRRLEGTRSVRKLAMRERYTKPIVLKLMGLESRYTYYLMWRGEVKGRVFSECATQQTRMARDIGWGRTINGLTTPHPYEYLYDKVCSGFSPDCDGDDYIMAKYVENGDFPPYLGSRVKTKVVSLQDENARTEPLVSTGARMARYLKWLNIGQNLIDVIVKCVESVCDVSIYDNFFDTDDTSGYTGSIEHRFNPAAASDGCFINYAPQVGSKVFMSSDHMPKYGKGKVNHTMHFQATYSALQYNTAMGKSPCSVHHHLICETCIVPCKEEIGDIRTDHRYIDHAFNQNIMPVIRDTIGYISERPKDIIFNPRRTRLIGRHVDLETEHNLSKKAYYGCLLLLGIKCASSLLIKGHGDQGGLGLDDLQSYPRIYSYKLYTNHVLDITSSVLLYLQCLRSEREPLGTGLFDARERVSRILDHSLLDKYKEIGSLCLGRTIKGTSEILDPIICTTYPEGPEDFIKGVRYRLIQHLDKTIELMKFPMATLCIPELDCNEREHKLILGYLIYAHEQCWRCASVGELPPGIWETNCREGHVEKYLRKLGVSTTTLDRLFKEISLKQKRVSPIIAVPKMESVTTLTDVKFLDLTFFFNLEMSIHLHKSKKVMLPTASVYKWAAVSKSLEFINPKNVIVLGDGTGGTSYVHAHIWPEARIYPMSKLEHYKAIPQDLMSIYPYLSRNLKNIEYGLIETIPDDIRNQFWPFYMSEAVSKFGGNTLVVVDIEGISQDEIMMQLLRLYSESDVSLLIKIYKHDFPWEQLSGLGFQMIITPFAHMEYQEMFIFIGPWSLDDHIQSDEQIFSLETALSDKANLELSLAGLIDLSKRMARHHLMSLYLNIKECLCFGDGEQLIAETLFHINKRYRFPQDKLRKKDYRNLTDGIYEKILRALKIIILSMSENINIDKAYWFTNMSIIRCPKGTRYPGLPQLKLIMAFGKSRYKEMTKKDYQVAYILRNNRNGKLFSFTTINSVYDLALIPGVNRRSVLPEGLISCIDQLENQSDLSGQKFT
ncbi:TPA_asm: polyprotein [Apera virus 1]|uniref:RNA-directed RNA polymerase n=1 Tax=Apera virus 1 TaxID=2977951 RepID=A0A9N6YJ63_9RHAB|nr:TPA_asm: polyprotein [Apera virus 1]